MCFIAYLKYPHSYQKGIGRPMTFHSDEMALCAVVVRVTKVSTHYFCLEPKRSTSSSQHASIILLRSLGASKAKEQHDYRSIHHTCLDIVSVTEP